MTTETTAKAYTGKPRGFAVIDPQRQREIASMGGRTAHQLGTAHQFNSETARAAGLKGAAVRGERPRKMTPEQEQEALRLRESGQTLRTVAAQFGVSYSTICARTNALRAA